MSSWDNAEAKKAAKIAREMGIKAKAITRQHYQCYVKLYRTMDLNGKEFTELRKQWQERIAAEGIHGLDWQTDNDSEYAMHKLFKLKQDYNV